MNGNAVLSDENDFIYVVISLEIMQLPESVGRFAIPYATRRQSSEKSASWKVILEPMTGNVVISEIDALAMSH
jgi:hypothetical protein